MRKKYLKPEVQSENQIEQTSLACNLIQDWEGVGGPALSTDLCQIDVTKGGNWYEFACAVAVIQEFCGPDTENGVPLS